MRSGIYCPECEELSILDGDMTIVQNGTTSIKCPLCNTTFKVTTVLSRLDTPMKYFAIVGGYSGKVIGVCNENGITGVIEEEPNVKFKQITEQEFLAFGD